MSRPSIRAQMPYSPPTNGSLMTLGDRVSSPGRASGCLAAAEAHLWLRSLALREPALTDWLALPPTVPDDHQIVRKEGRHAPDREAQARPRRRADPADGHARRAGRAACGACQQ